MHLTDSQSCIYNDYNLYICVIMIYIVAITISKQHQDVHGVDSDWEQQEVCLQDNKKIHYSIPPAM